MLVEIEIKKLIGKIKMGVSISVHQPSFESSETNKFETLYFNPTVCVREKRHLIEAVTTDQPVEIIRECKKDLNECISKQYTIDFNAELFQKNKE